jgi:hypothetical protein
MLFLVSMYAPWEDTECFPEHPINNEGVAHTEKQFFIVGLIRDFRDRDCPISQPLEPRPLDDNVRFYNPKIHKKS